MIAVSLLRHSTTIVTGHLRAMKLMYVVGQGWAIDQLDTVTEDLEHYSECCAVSKNKMSSLLILTCLLQQKQSRIIVTGSNTL